MSDRTDSCPVRTSLRDVFRFGVAALAALVWSLLPGWVPLPPSLRRAPPDLAAETDRIARDYGIATPTCLLLRSPVPEAFGVGVAGHNVLVLSTALVDALDPAQCRAVAAHELAHCRQGDATLFAALAGGVVAACLPARRIDRRSTRTVATAAVLSASALAIAAVARRREFRADRAVADRGEAAALASALRRLSGRRATRESTADADRGPVPTPDRRRPSDDLPGPDPNHRSAGDGPGGLDRAARLLAVHPDVDERIDRLETVAAGEESD